MEYKTGGQDGANIFAEERSESDDAPVWKPGVNWQEPVGSNNKQLR